MAGPLGSTPGIIVGVGVGAAASAAIEPAVELPRQAAWKANAHRLLDPAVMARLVASGGVDLATAQADGVLEGYGADKLNALVYLAQTVPGFAEAITAWRRGKIGPEDFTHTLIKAAIDARYYDAVKDLKDEWLTPQQVALGIVRGLLHDPGLMAVTLDAGAGNVTAYRESTIDALKEALGGGIDTERLRVMVGSIGLPMSTQAAAQATFRQIITRQDFNRSILEGDVRPEWADAIFEQARQHPTAHDYVEDHLRGWTTEAEMLAGTSKHGMSAADTQILFRINGRPLSFHQTFIGLARGGVYDGPTTGIDPAFLKSLQESNIRPEWYNLAWAQRYNYPTAFVLRSLTQGGDLTEAQTEQILTYEGWDPVLAKQVATKWAGGTGTTATQKKQTLAHLTAEYLSGSLSRAQLVTMLTGLGYSAQQADDEIALAEFTATKAVRTKATTAIGKRFIALQLTEAEARANMQALGWPTGAVDKFVAGWNAERDDEGTTLTQKQVLTAFKKGTLTAADALARLTVLGSSAADAQLLLDSQ